jgi:hypothetical protein
MRAHGAQSWVARLLVARHTGAMLDALTERALKEWRVIKGAPVAFAICVAFFGVLAFSGVSWHYSGQLETQKSTIDNQQERIQAQNDQLIDLRRQLDVNSKPATVTSRPSTALVKKLADQSNAELRGNASRFVAELRRFEAKFNVDDQMQQDMDWKDLRELLSGNDPDKFAKASKKGSENTSNYYERRKLHEENFNTRFRPSVLAYREEICRREEFVSPCETHNSKQSLARGLVDPIASELDNGILAGIYPIMQIADYLDKIIRNLPD